MRTNASISIATAALCLLISCAQPGVPLPPSLELPRPPSDLRAVRKGNSVTLSWTEPTMTTDRESERSLGDTEICRSPEAEIANCGNPVGAVAPPATVPVKPPHKPPSKPSIPRTFTDDLAATSLSDNPEAEITYAIEVLNRNGRGAGLSNRVHVPAIITLPAPKDVAVSLTDDGVALTWTSAGQPLSRSGLQFRYRIYRREEKTSTGDKTGKDVVAGEVPVDAPGPAHFLDAIEWEKGYVYRVTAVSIITPQGGEAQVEGDDSPTVHIFAHDVFPPAVPAGLQAVYSGEGQKPFIDLIWAPVTNADLAGYNVYRSEGEGAPVKVNSELVNTPSYRDRAMVTGKTYTYSVSAIDVRGNESARSEATSETVP